MNESNYLQFANEVLYNITNFWPYGAGMHRGLMEVPTKTMADAWNWIQNAQDGVLIPSQNSLQCKLGVANKLASQMEASHATLSLTACQLEEMAIDLYGPRPGKYYVVQNGAWAINSTGDFCGVCYVIAVRNEVPPTGGSATSCQAPPGILADPPTNLDSECCTKCKHFVGMSDLGCK